MLNLFRVHETVSYIYIILLAIYQTCMIITSYNVTVYKMMQLYNLQKCLNSNIKEMIVNEA